MGFLRRILRGGNPGEGARDGDAGGDGSAKPPVARADAATADEEERAHELELARFEQERTDDLVRRQQLYADRSWTPPPQGGERRAEDTESREG